MCAEVVHAAVYTVHVSLHDSQPNLLLYCVHKDVYTDLNIFDDRLCRIVGILDASSASCEAPTFDRSMIDAMHTNTNWPAPTQIHADFVPTHSPYNAS